MSSFIKPKVFNNLLKVQPKLTIPRKQVVRQYSSRPVVEANNGPTQRKKVTIHTLNNLYKKQIPISMLTAYDYPSGLWVEKSEADICLIGDSLGMVALGYPDTSSVTLNDMIHHSKAAFRGSKTAFRVVDLPMGSYELRPQLALETCFKIIKDTGAEAVKLEGGHEQTGVIQTLTQSGVAVVGHIGLTPQRLSQLGGFRIQGKTSDNAMRLVEDALAVQESGAVMMILECMPTLVAKMITQHLSIPTIGIGAGVYCSGQVLVTPDAIGMYDRFVPKFCKQYAQITPTVVESLKAYNDEVKKGQFPTDANSYPMVEGEEEVFLRKFNQRYLNGGLEFAEL